MRISRFLMLLLTVAFAVAGCAQAPAGRGLLALAAQPAPQPRPQGIDGFLYDSAVTPARTTGAIPAAVSVNGAVTEGPYKLDSGDRLRVVVFGQDGLSNSYVVDASGHIDMPLIGPVQARRVTTAQLAGRIADKLRQGYVRDPHVAVEVEAYRPFFILGEVTQPGQYPYVANMTVETAVAIAGGFTPRAFRKTVILSRIVDGRRVRSTVPVSYPLRPGDTVNVKERWF